MASGAKTGEGNGGQEDEDEFLNWDMVDSSLAIFVLVSYKFCNACMLLRNRPHPTVWNPYGGLSDC